MASVEENSQKLRPISKLMQYNAHRFSMKIVLARRRCRACTNHHHPLPAADTRTIIACSSIICLRGQIGEGKQERTWRGPIENGFSIHEGSAEKPFYCSTACI